MTSSFLSLTLFLLLANACVQAQVAVWGQCGGKYYTGSTICVSGTECVNKGEYYSQCTPSTSSPVPTSPSPKSSPSPSPQRSPSPSPVSTGSRLTYRGADISSVVHLEQSGISYKDTDGSVKTLERLAIQNGVNLIRQRIWVNPSDGRYNLAYNINLSKRVKSAGGKIFLDFHYSDTWADPAHQTTPAAWSSLSYDNLRWKVYNYTKDVCNSYSSNGLQLEIVSLGNEIANGLLWPNGKIDSFANIAGLLDSAYWGVKDSNLSPKPKIMLHLQDGYKWDTMQWFLDSLFAQSKFPSSNVDLLGFSYYPFYSSDATLSALKNSLTNVANKYGKNVMVAETDWPVSCPNAPTFPSDTRSIPFSVDGQSQWLRSIANVLKSVPNGRGVGLVYWEPGWIGNGGLGGACADNLFVDSNGKIRSSLNTLGNI
ncbi:hypothetical protein HK098_001314 [Nowakowskiella sp. JEL0407]|nr:hypothetical protein HK098_001314 [Nowakowskiella sp. JEL0407]